MEVEVSGPLVADDRSLIVAAALDGVGLAHIHEALVADHIARGELVRVLEDWCPALAARSSCTTPAAARCRRRCAPSWTWSASALNGDGPQCRKPGFAAR